MKIYEQKETKGTKETAKKTLAFSLPSPSFSVFFVTFCSIFLTIWQNLEPPGFSNGL